MFQTHKVLFDQSVVGAHYVGVTFGVDFIYIVYWYYSLYGVAVTTTC